MVHMLDLLQLKIFKVVVLAINSAFLSDRAQALLIKVSVAVQLELSGARRVQRLIYD